MTTFNVRSCNSKFVVPLLHVTDLQRMVEMGYLNKEDEIRKDGHRTWYPASTIVGLNFGNPENGDKKLLTVDDWTFQIHKASGKIEGPFGFKEIIKFANLGKLSTEDALLPPACTETIQLESFRSITISTPLQKLFAKWKTGKTNLPLRVQLLQKLIDDGEIPENCLVRGEDESKWTKWSNYTSPRDLRMSSNYQRKIEIQQKQTATNTTFSYFPRKITAACITLGIICALLFVFKENTLSFISNRFNDVSVWIGLNNPEVVDTPPTQTDETTPVEFTTVPHYENTITHIPQFGPMWFNEKLALPVFGAFVAPYRTGIFLQKYPQYPLVWMPQLLFVDAPAVLIDPTTGLKANSRIHKIKRKSMNRIRDRLKELKGNGFDALITRGYYHADPFGISTWCEDVVAGKGKPSQTVHDKELFLIGQWMGLDNWIEYELSNNELSQWLVSPEDSLGNSVTPILDRDGKIERIDGDKKSIGFKEDQGRATATWYDLNGDNEVPFLRWENRDDSKVESFELFAENANKADKNTNSMVWTPQYSKNRILSLGGKGDSEVSRRNYNGTIHYSIDVRYSYNDSGQIIQAILRIYSSTIEFEDEEDEFTSEESETIFTTDYSYIKNKSYWVSATMAGERTNITFNRDRTPPSFYDTDLGKIRYKREFIDNSK